MARKTRREMARAGKAQLNTVGREETVKRDSQPAWVRVLCEEIGARPYIHRIGTPMYSRRRRRKRKGGGKMR